MKLNSRIFPENSEKFSSAGVATLWGCEPGAASCYFDSMWKELFRERVKPKQQIKNQKEIYSVRHHLNSWIQPCLKHLNYSQDFSCTWINPFPFRLKRVWIGLQSLVQKQFYYLQCLPFPHPLTSLPIQSVPQFFWFHFLISMIISRSIHVAANGIISFFFMAE